MSLTDIILSEAKWLIYWLIDLFVYLKFYVPPDTK